MWPLAMSYTGIFTGYPHPLRMWQKYSIPSGVNDTGRLINIPTL